MMNVQVGNGPGVQLRSSLRIVIVTIVACCVVYPLAILGFAQSVTPYTANGSLLLDRDGRVIGSEKLAQAFTRPEYFHPRPSAVDYKANAAGGSNLSPAGQALRDRALESLKELGATAERKAPADLVTASGSGMDPDITLHAARWQADRVARARGLPRQRVLNLLDGLAERPGGVLSDRPLINVLKANLALDRLTAANL